LNWKNLALTGSVIAATCRNKDPMELDSGQDTETFFNTYYPDSDIDVMCDLQNYESFIDKINYFVSVITENIKQKIKGSTDEIVNVNISKTAYLHLNQSYFNPVSITTEMAYELYCSLKKKETMHSEKYQIIDKVCSIENFKYYVYNNDIIKEPYFNENIKYHISSAYLSRKFEIFKIKYNFLSTVSRFHLACVRGYYNGENVYLIPSAISALLTNTCIDYKYFAGVRSPFEIILKYNFRGFTILLNKKEMIKMVEYIKNSIYWSKLYKVDDSFKISTFNTYYSNPFVLLDKPNINYVDYRVNRIGNIISPIISSIGYILPLKN